MSYQLTMNSPNKFTSAAHTHALAAQLDAHNMTMTQAQTHAITHAQTMDSAGPCTHDSAGFIPNKLPLNPSTGVPGSKQCPLLVGLMRATYALAHIHHFSPGAQTPLLWAPHAHGAQTPPCPDRHTA
jgi:hypothetical protein